MPLLILTPYGDPQKAKVISPICPHVGPETAGVKQPLMTDKGSSSMYAVCL